MSVGHKTCCFVLKWATKGSQAEYCGEPSTHTTQKDESGDRYREYSGLCSKHKEIVEQDNKVREACLLFIRRFGIKHARASCPYAAGTREQRLWEITIQDWEDEDD